MSTELARGAGTDAPSTARVLVVASSGSAPGLAEALRQHGHDVVECATAETGCAALAEQHHDAAFVAVDLADAITSTAADLGIPVILVGGGSGAIAPACAGRIAAEASVGAAPVLVALLLEREHLRRENTRLEATVDGVRDGTAMVGRSPVMRRLHTALSRAADSDATVLIEGAPGAGKSLAARVIHCKSRRGNRPLVAVAAATLDGEAMQQAFATARGTTLVLEDVEQLPQAGQQALVRFLKERTTGAGGGAAPARLVATTSAHLPELVGRGAFREDLYYRLHAYPIVVPALRERTEDIAPLADALLGQLAGSTAQRTAGFTPAARMLLESMPWPGNVAQLEHVVRRAFFVAGGAPVDDRHLIQPAGAPEVTATSPVAVAVDDQEEVSEAAIRPFDDEEQRLLSRALRATRGNVRRAAQLLGIGRATLYRKIQQYKLRLQ